MTSFAFIPNIGLPELIIILVVALVIFGPGKLPDVGKAVGRAINEFKRASNNVKNEFDEAVRIEEETFEKKE